MVWHHEYLPYEVRKTACELYAGRTGFTQEEMQVLFTEEIRKVVSPSSSEFDENTFWDRLGNVMDRMAFQQKLRLNLLATEVGVGCLIGL